jgi:hypothetical protein
MLANPVGLLTIRSCGPKWASIPTSLFQSGLQPFSLARHVHVLNVMTVLYRKESRNEERISVDILVEITWHNPEGNAVTERTRIEDVTSVGCRFRIQVQLQRGEVVSILALSHGKTSLANGQLQLYEIMWSAQEGSRWNTGALRLEGEKLTKAFFPQSNSSKQPLP